MLNDRLREMLEDVRSLAGPAFAGIGVLVCRDLATLPITPLRPRSQTIGAGSTLARLIHEPSRQGFANLV